MSRWIALGLLAALVLGACASAQGKPEDAVPPYLQALLANDEDALLRATCPEWEEQAARDLAAFSGVTGELHDARCTVAGTDGNYTLVTCTGTMQINYNGELRDRSLEGQTYRVKEVDGDWKMCGYQ